MEVRDETEGLEEGAVGEVVDGGVRLDVLAPQGALQDRERPPNKGGVGVRLRGEGESVARLRKSSCCLLLGANGAGKTTLARGAYRVCRRRT